MFKRKVVKFEIPDDARELTDEELLLVNGGAIVGNSIVEQAKAKPGDILIDDNGKEHELNPGDIKWAQDEMAKRNGTETPPPASGGTGGGTSGSGGSSGGGSGSGSSGASGTDSGSSSNGSTTPTTNNNGFKNVNLMDGWYENSTIGKLEKSKNQMFTGNKIEGSSPVGAKIPTQQVRDLKHVYIPIEGVCYGNVSVQTTYFSDENGNLNVSTSSSYSDRFNRESVSEYEYFGNVTLLKDGKEVEKKPIIRPEGDIVYDSRYDYIGTATFDYPIDSYSNYSIKSDINLVVNRFPWKMKFEHEVNR